MSPWVGFISPQSTAVPMPTALSWLQRKGDALAPVTLSHSAPTGTVAGDRMMLTWTGYTLWGAQGDDGTMTPDAAWTQLAKLNDSTSAQRQRFYLFTKIADAADEAGTSSYSWAVVSDASYTQLLCTTIPQENGTSITSPAIDSAGTGDTTMSLAAPAGDWQYVVALGKLYSASGTDPVPACSNSGASLLHGTYTADGNNGIHRHYSLAGGETPVTGTIVNSGTDQRGVLMSLGVTA